MAAEGSAGTSVQPGKVGSTASLAELEKSVQASPDKLHVLFFWASFHEASLPGSQVDNLLQSLAAKFVDVAFLKVDAEGADDIVDKYEVSSVPFFVFIKNGITLSTVEGGNGADIMKGIQEGRARVLTQEDKAAALHAKLKRLTTAAAVMLFMKGTPSAPRCKFSRACVELLARHSIQYSSFDVLSDPDVRAGLKEFSKWPTYPQLYAKGELVGGLDILKELEEDGELASTLAVAPTPAPAPASSASTQGSESLQDKLKRLTTASDVVLFMKGTPAAPQCGFSASAIEVLAQAGVSNYTTFNILSDPDVRAGLKEFSKWPTYPQLYAKGELVGGLDIMKELQEDGELADVLAA